METWKKIKGYDYHYVSSEGRVKSVDHFMVVESDKVKSYKRKKKGRILKQQDNGKGYLAVGLPGSSRQYVHRLVADAFLDNHDNKPTVNHINGNKKDNRLINLEWTTYSENQFHSKATGLAGSGPFHPQSKLTFEQFRYIIENYKPRHPEHGCNALARKFGVTSSVVHKILKRHGL